MFSLLKYWAMLSIGIAMAHSIGAEADSSSEDTLSIESSYTDEATQGAHLVRGSGFLVRVPGFFGDRVFAVTASHVSQGKKLKITAGDKELPIIGRLADNASDLEVIEIKAPEEIKPLATLDGKALVVSAKERARLWQEVLQNDQHMLLSSDHMVVLQKKWTDKKANWGNKPADEILKKYAGGSYMFSAGVSQGIMGDTFQRDVWEQNLQRVGGDQWITARLKLRPGMSGSALVTQEKHMKDGAIVQGVASHFSRDFNRSYFVPARKIINLINQYDDGTRERTACTAWKMRDGLTYRDYCSGTVEINPLLPTSGDGTKADGGDGTKADGGDHERIGDMAPMSAGIMWKDKPVVAFGLTPKEGTMQATFMNFRRVIYADRFALERLPELEKTYDIKALESNARIIDVLGEKAERVWVQGPSAGTVCGGVDHNFAKDKKTEILLDRERLRIKIPTCFGDVVDINVPATMDHFSPIIKTKGNKTGYEYAIDLRSIFFEDLSQAIINDGPFADQKVGILSFPGMASPRESGMQIVNTTLGIEHYVPFWSVDSKKVAEVAVKLNESLSRLTTVIKKPCSP